MVVRNLLDELVKVACDKVGHRQDHRFQPWAKLITSVDTSKDNGYAFEGEFVKDGTVEVEEKPYVFIVKTSSGSAKYQVAYYNVVVMKADGALEATDIQTTNKTHGWALRIRGQIANLVAEMSGQEPDPLAAFSDDILIAALEKRGYQIKEVK